MEKPQKLTETTSPGWMLFGRSSGIRLDATTTDRPVEIDWVGMAPKVAETLNGRPADDGDGERLKWTEYPAPFVLYTGLAFFVDYAAQESGDVLSMVSHLLKVDSNAALDWLKQQGYLSEDAADNVKCRLVTETKVSEPVPAVSFGPYPRVTLGDGFEDQRGNEETQVRFAQIGRQRKKDLQDQRDSLCSWRPWEYRMFLLTPQLAEANVHQYANRYRSEGIPICFCDAVDLASALLTCCMANFWEENDPVAAVLFGHILADYVRCMLPKLLPAKIDESAADIGAWRFLRLTLKTLRMNKLPVPPALNQWALEVAEGERSKPKSKPGASGATNNARNRCIVRTLNDLRNCGLQPRRHGRMVSHYNCGCGVEKETMNPNEEELEYSGCDVVRLALERRRIYLAYSGVEKIWQRNKRNYDSSGDTTG